MSESKKRAWQTYCTEQLSIVTPLLLDEGFLLEEEQPHLQGERYVLSGPKLVLYGVRKDDDLRVVIKITNDPTVAEEMQREQGIRETLNTMRFAYKTFFSPNEVLSGQKDTYTFYITEYVPQEKKFLEHSLREQFFLALKAFEAQEGSHATTHQHLQTVRKVFDVLNANDYIRNTKRSLSDIEHTRNTTAQSVLENISQELKDGTELLERYSHFLTHWDFVPHNIRIHNGDMYLLDHTAIRFGNKYEGWARFMNFMTLYNPELEHMLDSYVHENRGKDEHETLRLMRLYRLSELIYFYVNKKEVSEGNLKTLSEARVMFWCEVARTQLERKALPQNVLNEYRQKRDTLRDEEEQKRQEVLH